MDLLFQCLGNEATKPRHQRSLLGTIVPLNAGGLWEVMTLSWFL